MKTIKLQKVIIELRPEAGEFKIINDLGDWVILQDIEEKENKINFVDLKKH